MRCINRRGFLLSLGHGPRNCGASIEMALARLGHTGTHQHPTPLLCVCLLLECTWDWGIGGTLRLCNGKELPCPVLPVQSSHTNTGKPHSRRSCLLPLLSNSQVLINPTLANGRCPSPKTIFNTFKTYGIQHTAHSATNHQRSVSSRSSPPRQQCILFCSFTGINPRIHAPSSPAQPAQPSQPVRSSQTH